MLQTKAKVPFDKTVIRQSKSFFPVFPGSNSANCQLLFASCSFCQRSTHQTHVRPKSSVVLYHLFAYRSSKKRPRACENVRAHVVEQAFMPAVKSKNLFFLAPRAPARGRRRSAKQNDQPKAERETKRPTKRPAEGGACSEKPLGAARREGPVN